MHNLRSYLNISNIIQSIKQNKCNKWRNYIKKIMWIILRNGGVHEKDTHLALESHIWDCLTNPSMPTTQRLDGKDKDNQRTQNFLVITMSQEQKILKRF